MKYILSGHVYWNDVQTLIQVFFPNLHYYETDTPQAEGLTVESRWNGTCAEAVLYENGVEKSSASFPGEENSEKEAKRCIKGALYHLLSKETGFYPQWGILTGVRPAKLANGLLKDGMTEEAAFQYLTEKYLVSPQKAKLMLQVGKEEQRILDSCGKDEVSLYIGIPFCPTRCLYCSFTAYPFSRYAKRVDAYLDALTKELTAIRHLMGGKRMRSIYIGGGTPTTLNEEQLKRLLHHVAQTFPLERDMEYTVEAGRPDTITREKLEIIKAYGADRISINPQTMNDHTLALVGRKHTAAQVEEIFHLAREAGHNNINMDLILGLPEEKPADVKRTMERIAALQPDNLTVHTLAVKRASRLKEELENFVLTQAGVIEEMLAIAAEGAGNMGMHPYYMYRQKNMVGNFENVGYCLPGKEGIYNVQIMEEKQTIFAAGAGGTTKMVEPATDRIERAFNVKSVEDYIARIDEMIARKEALAEKLGGRI